MISHVERITLIVNLDLKIRVLSSSLCDYSDAYIPVKGIITGANIGTAAPLNYADKKVIFKNCVPFTGCISRINNTKKEMMLNILI